MDRAAFADLYRRRAKALRDQADVEDAFAALLTESEPSASGVSDIGRARARKRLRTLGVPIAGDDSR